MEKQEGRGLTRCSGRNASASCCLPCTTHRMPLESRRLARKRDDCTSHTPRPALPRSFSFLDPTARISSPFCPLATLSLVAPPAIPSRKYLPPPQTLQRTLLQPAKADDTKAHPSRDCCIPERVQQRRLLVHQLEEVLVGDHDQGIDRAGQEAETLLGEAHSEASLEAERLIVVVMVLPREQARGGGGTKRDWGGKHGQVSGTTTRPVDIVGVVDAPPCSYT